MNKCSKCGATEDDYLTFDNRREVDVILKPTRFGYLCQRHIRNLYARNGRQRKRAARIEQERKAHDEATGQLSMFKDM